MSFGFSLSHFFHEFVSEQGMESIRSQFENQLDFV